MITVHLVADTELRDENKYMYLRSLDPISEQLIDDINLECDQRDETRRFLAHAIWDLGII